MDNENIKVKVGDVGHLVLLLRNLSTALFGIFIVCVVVDNLPLRLLEPAWLYSFAASLVNFVTIPLAGYGFLHLACYLSPTSRQDAYLARIGKMAQMAALGFLLLLPLLAYSGYSNARRIVIGNEQQKRFTQRNVSRLVQAINLAVTPQELQAQMVALQGPRISNDALQVPLQTLKEEARVSVKQAQAVIEARLKSPYSPEFLPLYKQFVRTALLSLVSAFGFAALAWWPGKQNAFSSGLLGKNLPFGPAWVKCQLAYQLKPLKGILRGLSKRLTRSNRLKRAYDSQRKKNLERQKALKRTQGERRKLRSQLRRKGEQQFPRHH